MRLTIKTCLTVSFVLSTTLVGCSLLSCQPSSSERPKQSNVTVSMESPPLKAQPNLSASLMKMVLSAPEGQALLQRSMMKLYLEARGVQDESLRGIPSWEKITLATSQLQPEPTDEQLKRLYESRHPQNLSLVGVQFTLIASHRWSASDRNRFKASLTYWARSVLSKARQALLQGSPIDETSSLLNLTLRQGAPLIEHLSQLRSPHILGTIKRLRAGEVSQVIEHEEGACLYMSKATSKLLKDTLPRAVSDLRSRLDAQRKSSPQERSLGLSGVTQNGALRALCLDVSLTGLKGSTGRAFDRWLRAKVLTLKELGALNQSTLDAFSLSVKPLSPEEWPPQLIKEALSSPLSDHQAHPHWLQAEAKDQLWLAYVNQRVEVTFAQERPALRALFLQRRGESINQRLLIEQGWEELSPVLRVQTPDGSLEEIELPAPEID